MRTRKILFVIVAIMAAVSIPLAASATGTTTPSTNRLALQGPVGTCTNYHPNVGRSSGSVRLIGPVNHVFTAEISAKNLAKRTDYEVYFEEPTLFGGTVVGCAYSYIGAAYADSDGRLQSTKEIVFPNGGEHNLRIVLQKPPYSGYLTNPSVATSSVLVGAD